METEKFDITICLGSSCFARGNKQIVNIIKEYLKERDLEEKVYFHGNHCFDNCIDGPVIKINDEIYKGVEEDDVKKILDKFFYTV